MPGVEIRIVDDAGADLAPGETGELLIRSDAAMDGYLAQPEETAATLVDGWFRTGDLARVSPEGFVSIVGRKKELILRGGYSVSPPEVEAALLAHPAVAEAAVIGVPHPDLGEEVAAFVALRPGAAVTPDDLVAWCKERVAGYKCPRVITVLRRASEGRDRQGAEGPARRGCIRITALTASLTARFDAMGGCARTRLGVTCRTTGLALDPSEVDSCPGVSFLGATPSRS